MNQSNHDILNYGSNFANLAGQLASADGMASFLQADPMDATLTKDEQAEVAFHRNNHVFASVAQATRSLQVRNQDVRASRITAGTHRGDPHRSIIARAVDGNRLMALHATKGWRVVGSARS